MVTKEEFGQFVSEIESFREMMTEQLIDLREDMEKLKEDFSDLKKEIEDSGKIKLNKKIT